MYRQIAAPYSGNKPNSTICSIYAVTSSTIGLAAIALISFETATIGIDKSPVKSLEFMGLVLAVVALEMIQIAAIQHTKSDVLMGVTFGKNLAGSAAELALYNLVEDTDSYKNNESLSFGLLVASVATLKVATQIFSKHFFSDEQSKLKEYGLSPSSQALIVITAGIVLAELLREQLEGTSHVKSAVELLGSTAGLIVSGFAQPLAVHFVPPDYFPTVSLGRQGVNVASSIGMSDAISSARDISSNDTLQYIYAVAIIALLKTSGYVWGQNYSLFNETGTKDEVRPLVSDEVSG